MMEQEVTLRGRPVVAPGPGSVEAAGVEALDHSIPEHVDVLAVCASSTVEGTGLAAVTPTHLHLWDASSSLTIALPWEQIAEFDLEQMSLVTVEGDRVQLLVDSVVLR